MWAGCETDFYSKLYIGDKVTKISSVDDISLKEGSLENYVLLKRSMNFM